MELHGEVFSTLKNSARCLGNYPMQLPIAHVLSSIFASQSKMPTTADGHSPTWCPPSSTSNRPVTVLGAGDRARRIACPWASAGYDVNIQDRDGDRCDAALRHIHINASSFAEQLGRKSSRVGKCRGLTDPARAASHSWLVIEARQGPREMEVDTLSEIDSVSLTDCILASASSFSKSNPIFSMTIMRRRSRTCCIRYSPFPSSRAVELLPSHEADPALLPVPC